MIRKKTAYTQGFTFLLFGKVLRWTVLYFHKVIESKVEDRYIEDEWRI